MKFYRFTIGMILLAGLLLAAVAWRGSSPSYSSVLGQEKPAGSYNSDIPDQERSPATALFAGGCFWSMEAAFDKAPGVVDVISGYGGGRTRNPRYANYARGGHREVVLVAYDPETITYAGLVEYLIKHIDPTDSRGSFVDRGRQYSPAIYYESQDEKDAAAGVIAAINELKVFSRPFNVAILPRPEFWPAEAYHQDYHNKKAALYAAYRRTSGRDAFLLKYWGGSASLLTLPGAFPTVESRHESSSQDSRDVTVSTPANFTSDEGEQPWKSFKKPSAQVLRTQLSPMQYKVTQRNGTEKAFNNDYWNNHQAGLYVDVVSGEPLFSSLDKFESGTGWPSFVKPLEPSNIVTRVDRSLFSVRTEVRSKYGDSHLGHVFNDGPPNRGGMRYCMNSAALRFIPLKDLKKEGYGAYESLFR